MAKYQSKYKGSQIDNLLDFVNDNKDDIALKEEIPEIPSIPRNVSELSNDLGFITNTVTNLVSYYTKSETYTKSEINTLVNNAASGGFIKVNELPTENINTKAIYLVPYTGSKAKNLYEEYIYIDNDWEMIGTTKLDLSNYVTNDVLSTTLNDYVTNASLSTSLSEYVAITALNTALADYIKTTDLNTLIDNYYNKTEIAGLLADKIDTNKIGAANGVASLGNDGKIPSSQLPEQSGSGVSNFDDLTNKPTALKAFTPPSLPSIFGGKVCSYDPIGTVIAFMGTTAPENYLVCDGTEYNIADYKNLADFFENQFGEKNYFGGNGTTTFAVPDLRGEFLRGSGTNNHANQGSGGDVGEHQDGSEISPPYTYSTNSFGVPETKTWTDSTFWDNIKPDTIRKATNVRYSDTMKTAQMSSPYNYGTYTSRPTNTSVLYCIKYKTDEKYQLIYDDKERVVGEWFGKKLYQKVVYFETHIAATNSWTNLNCSNFPSDIDELASTIIYEGYGTQKRTLIWTPSIVSIKINDVSNLFVYTKESENDLYCAVIQYTKTTD